jgi:hypothetical protein
MSAVYVPSMTMLKGLGLPLRRRGPRMCALPIAVSFLPSAFPFNTMAMFVYNSAYPENTHALSPAETPNAAEYTPIPKTHMH